MYQFFVEDEQVQQDRICIVGGDVNHIGHVLRMKTGEKIRISDQSGRSYFCRILEITEEEVWAQIEDTDAPSRGTGRSLAEQSASSYAS